MKILDDLIENVAEGVNTSKEALKALFIEANQKKLDIITHLSRSGVASETRLLEAFAKALNIPFIARLIGIRVPDIFIEKVPVQYARNFNLIGIDEDDKTLVVATTNPFLIYPIDELSLMVGKPIRIALTSKEEIVNLINAAYQKKVGIVEETLEELNESEILKVAQEVSDSQDLLTSASKAPVIKLVSMMIFHALKLRSSDIHIQPYEDKAVVRYRIDGILYDMLTIPKVLQNAVTTRVKVMSDMDIAERRLPQDGRTTVTIGEKVIDVRVSTVPSFFGERIVMRLLDKSARLYELEELGMQGDHLRIFNELIHFSHGIILVTGPTGSGKSTTLYACLKRLNVKEKNIITIEDPIEYQLPGISQIEVNVAAGLTFANGLRSILRQDPNIIMVGEIRDSETATIAIQSALTGHLVFSTLHTNDAPGAITRLLDLGIEPYLIASSIIGVCAQRLVRLICPHCKEEYKPEKNVLDNIGIPEDEVANGKLWRGRGCSNCFNTGYKDRTGIYELLPINDDIRELIMQRKSASEIRSLALKSGFRTLRMDGINKVLKGITTIDEVLRVTQMDLE